MKTKSYSRGLALLATILMMAACTVTKYVPIASSTQTTTITKDSLVIRKDTITVEVPVESHTNVTEQHSFLETSVATSTAYVDTTGLLHHQLQNKQTSLKREVQYVDRYVETVRDSLVRVEVPVEVEKPVKYVPRWCKILLGFNILMLVLIGALAYIKVKKTQLWE